MLRIATDIDVYETGFAPPSAQFFATETLRVQVVFQENGSPLDITGATVSAYLRDIVKTDTEMTAAIESAGGGTVLASLVPDTLAAGFYDGQVTLQLPSGRASTAEFRVMVREGFGDRAATAPAFTTPPSLTPVAAAIGETITLSLGAASGIPAPGLTGVLTLDGQDVTPLGSTYTVTAPGALVYTVTATNSEGSVQSVANATATDIAPVAGSLQPLTFTEGTEAQVSASEGFTEGTNLVYALVSPPENVSIDAATGLVIFASSFTGVGSFTLEIEASNSGGTAQVSQSYTVEAAASAFTTTITSLSRDQSIFDSGAHLDVDPALATIPVTGATDAPDGSDIQLRSVEAIYDKLLLLQGSDLAGDWLSVVQNIKARAQPVLDQIFAEVDPSNPFDPTIDPRFAFQSTNNVWYVQAGNTVILQNEYVDFDTVRKLKAETGAILVCYNCVFTGLIGNGGVSRGGGEVYLVNCAIVGPGDGSDIGGSLGNYVTVHETARFRMFGCVCTGYGVDLIGSGVNATQPMDAVFIGNYIDIPTGVGPLSHADVFHFGGASAEADTSITDTGAEIWWTYINNTVHTGDGVTPSRLVVPGGPAPDLTHPPMNAIIFAQDVTGTTVIRGLVVEGTENGSVPAPVFANAGGVDIAFAALPLVASKYIATTSSVQLVTVQDIQDFDTGAPVTAATVGGDAQSTVDGIGVAEPGPALAQAPQRADVQANAWQTLAGAAQGGAWSGEMTCPRSVMWYFIEAQVSGSSALPSQMTTACAAGHVWAIWEQSNWARLTLYNSTQGWLVENVLRPNDVQISDREGSFVTFDDGVVQPINDDQFISPAIVSFANAFSRSRKGEKLMVGWHAKGGTSTTDTLSTEAEALADTYGIVGDVRDWNAEYTTHRALTRDGTQVGVLWVAGWIASNGGGGPIATQTMAPTFLAKDASGAAIDPRDANVIRELGLPRLFCAVTQDGRDFGYYEPGVVDNGGLYDMRYSKLGWLGPHGRARTGMPLAADVTALSDLSGYLAGDDQDYQALVEDIDGMHNGNPAFPECLPWLGVTHGAERQDGDEAHMHAGSPDGRQRLARIGMFYALQQLGLITTPLPRLDQRFDATNGSGAYFGIAGRDLTTERLARVAAGETLSNENGGGNPAPDIIPELPNLPASHRSEVMGFSINNTAATDATIYTVLSSDADLLAAGFAIGQRVALVRPNSGSFTFADSIVYGVDRLPGYQVAEDYDDNVRAFLNWLVVDMGQADLPRLPAQHQGLLLAQQSTLPAPAAFRVTNATSWQSAGDVASSFNQMAFEVKGVLSTIDPGEFIQLGGTTSAKLGINNSGSLDYRDGGGGNLVYSDVLVAPAVGFHIRVQFDRSTSTVTLIDVENGNTVSGVSSSGNFPSNPLNFLPNDVAGDFERLVAWVGTITPDWDNQTPDFGIDAVSGGAGYVEYGGLTLTGPAPVAV